MINELIEQIGGRGRLEEIRTFTHTNGIEHCNRQEWQIMARALLALLDAQGKAFGCDSCGGNGAVVIDHGEMGVEHMECPKCLKRPPAASVPDGWKLMPLKASPEILQAGIKAHYERQKYQQPEDVKFKGPMECAYDDMLSAAPAPGGDGG